MQDIKTEWEYCPECGSEDHMEGYNQENGCIDCHQSWFSNHDYTDVVRGHLKASYKDRYKTSAINND